MKSKKQMIFALPALLALGICAIPMTACNNTNQPSSQANSETSSQIGDVSVSVSPKSATIYLNDESNTIQLNAQLVNGEGKSLVWSSDDESVASVSGAGLVTGHKLGKATITVATNDGSASDTASITVKQDRTQDDTVNSLQKPSFLINYESKTATLDDVTGIVGNNNPSRTSYYKNADGTKDIYKVGNQNDFKAQITGIAINPETLEDQEIANPFTNVKVEKFNKTSKVYEELTESDLTANVAINAAHNSYKFTDAAAGNQFKITVSVDETKYADVSEYCSPVVMEFEVFDGFNVYTKDELSVMDNWQNSAWAEKKTAAGVADVEAKGIALHSNLIISNNDIPSSFKFTADDINNYIASYGSDWNDYVSKKKANRPTQAEIDAFNADVAKSNLIDSVKDWTTVYLRKTTGNDNFKFEGNYNTIDFSGIKQIFAFGSNALRDGKLSPNYFPDNNGSHGQLFGFNTELDNNPPEIGGGQYFINNVTVIGNGDRSDDDNYEGGLITYKARSTDIHFENVISSKTFITFLLEVDKDERADAIHVPTRSYMDRCKSFDSYNSMIYVWGTETNIITNSVMDGAGGAILLLDDVNADEATAKIHGTPKVDCYNVNFNNLLTGNEPWFVNHQASALVQLMELFGTQSKWLGRNAIAHGDHMNIATVDAKGNPFIDLIAIDISDDPLGNSLATGGSPLKGHCNIYNDANMTQLLAGLDMSKMAVADPREGTEAFIRTALSEYQQGNVLPLYRMIALNNNSAGMVVVSSAGGHAMLSSTEYDNGIIATLNYPNYSALPIAGLATTIPGTPYEVDPFPFYNGETELAYNLGMADNMNKLASGDYLSLYFQSPTADGNISEYIGAFIKMHQIGA